MNELALFQGAGGGTLGSKLLGWRTVCGVEIHPYCREVILRRQEEGILEPFPIWDDIKTFDGKPWRGKVDIVTGGFPCQPFSVAGKQEGQSDQRNMWPDTIRVIREVRPRYCFLENVPNLLTHEYFGTILGDLAESGYDAQWRCLSAAECGAPHRRARLWIMAYSRYHGGSTEQGEQQEVGAEVATGSGTARESKMADAGSKRSQGISEGRNIDTPEGYGERGATTGRDRTAWWNIDPADLHDAKSHEGRISHRDGGETTDNRPTESFVGRVVDGLAYILDEFRTITEGGVA